MNQQQNNYRGAPRGRGHSGGNRRAARDAMRAYHYNDRRQQEDWAYEPEPYDPWREQANNRRQTARSQSWKQKSKPDKKEEKKEIQTVKPSTEDSGARDEPLYDIGPHSTLTPVLDCFTQNFEFSGFIPIVNQTYEKMRGVDPRLHDRLPLSMFTHAMSTHLNLEILEVARNAGQNVLNLRTDAREILPDYQVVPQSIVDYISHITDAITQDGKELRLNLPAVAIPQGPLFADNVQIAESGTFGILNAQSHNVYECYISPYVTSARVLASQQQEQDYDPLPPELVAGNLIPNRNLLGYEAIDVDNHGARARLQGIIFPSDNTLEGRYRFSPLLQTRVYTVLAELKDKMKMVEMRRENNPQGLNTLEKIKRKVTSVNLTSNFFVESIGPVNDAQIPLFERTVNVHSFGAQGSSVANQANIECFHRRRMIQGAHMARGFCCLTEAGQGPGGWAATCNDNFNMAGLFAPVLHQDYPEIFNKRIPIVDIVLDKACHKEIRK